MRKTKIICTVGPSIDSVNKLTCMMKKGMNVARLNFSHAVYDQALKQISKIRTAATMANKHVAIMLDTKGPEIRTGLFVEGEAKVSKGDIIKIVPDEIEGTNKEFYITYPELYYDLNIGDAILDGCDAIMLSGESAIGAYPLESVEMMDRIAKSSENMINYQKRLGKEMINNFHTQNEAISICVCECAVSLDDVVAIFAFTETGGTAKRICRFRPSVPLIACTDSIETCRRLSYYCGVIPVATKYVNDISMCDEIAVEVARNFGFKKGSKIILTGGFGQEHGITNTIRILEI